MSKGRGVEKKALKGLGMKLAGVDGLGGGLDRGTQQANRPAERFSDSGSLFVERSVAKRIKSEIGGSWIRSS